MSCDFTSLRQCQFQPIPSWHPAVNQDLMFSIVTTVAIVTNLSRYYTTLCRTFGLVIGSSPSQREIRQDTLPGVRLRWIPQHVSWNQAKTSWLRWRVVFSLCPFRRFDPIEASLLEWQLSRNWPENKNNTETLCRICYFCRGWTECVCVCTDPPLCAKQGWWGLE